MFSYQRRAHEHKPRALKLFKFWSIQKRLWFDTSEFVSNYGSVHIYYLWRERATKCKQRVPISNSSRIRIFVETIVSNIFKFERLMAAAECFSVLIFDWRQKKMLSSAQCPAQVLNYWESGPLTCVNWAKSCVKNS